MPQSTRTTAVEPATSTIVSPHDLGSVLRAARRRHGLTQSDAADLLGVDRWYVSGLERGQEVLLLQRTLALLDLYGLTLDVHELPADEDEPRHRSDRTGDGAREASGGGTAQGW